MNVAVIAEGAAGWREQLEILRAENLRLREGINRVLGGSDIPEWAITTLLESLDEWWMP